MAGKQSDGYIYEKPGKERGKKQFVARLTFSDSAGKRRNLTKSCRTKNEAKDALATLRAKVQAGKAESYLSGKAEVLDSFLDRWLRDVVEPSLKINTAANYRQLLRLYVRPVLGKKRLADLRTAEIQSLYGAMAKRGLSARTVSLTHSILHKALKVAVQWKLISENPTENTTLPKQDHREMNFLTPEQARRFLEAALAHPDGLLFVLMLETGLRPAEVLGLQWPDIDLDRGRLTVNRSLVRPKDGTKGWQLDSPKTEKSRRTIPLSAHLLPLLRAHRQTQRKARLQAGSAWQDFDFVFTSSNGQPFSHCNLRGRQFQAILKSAGLENLRWYDLRHSTASIALSAGENLKVISERLGHADIRTTSNVYAHVSESLQREATDRIASQLYPVNTKKAQR